MILGFRANINEDSHRIFLTRLKDNGVNFKGAPSETDRNYYCFLFDSEQDFRLAQVVKKSMVEKYPNIPMHKNL